MKSSEWMRVSQHVKPEMSSKTTDQRHQKHLECLLKYEFLGSFLNVLNQNLWDTARNPIFIHLIHVHGETIIDIRNTIVNKINKFLVLIDFKLYVWIKLWGKKIKQENFKGWQCWIRCSGKVYEGMISFNWRDKAGEDLGNYYIKHKDLQVQRS